MAEPNDPFREADDDARALARTLLENATIAALGFVDPETGAPAISRIGLGLTEAGTLLSLVSDLALHSRALRRDPRAALLVGEPLGKGDPLNGPRLSLSVTARFVPPDIPERAMFRSAWLARHPKAKLYVDFADFHFIRFDATAASLNGGFGRAYRLVSSDLPLSSTQR